VVECCVTSFVTQILAEHSLPFPQTPDDVHRLSVALPSLLSEKLLWPFQLLGSIQSVLIRLIATTAATAVTVATAVAAVRPLSSVGAISASDYFRDYSIPMNRRQCFDELGPNYDATLYSANLPHSGSLDATSNPPQQQDY